MGYCTYTPNKNTGGALAAWIGTSGEKVGIKYVSFLKGSLGATNKTAACNEARKQFCAANGIPGCYKAPTSPKKLTPRVATPQQGCSLLDASQNKCTWPDIDTFTGGSGGGSGGGGSSGGGGGLSGVDADCNGYWLGPDACVAGKSFIKGIQGIGGGLGIGAQYVLPILAAGGILFLVILLKR